MDRVEKKFYVGDTVLKFGDKVMFSLNDNDKARGVIVCTNKLGKHIELAVSLEDGVVLPLQTISESCSMRIANGWDR